MKSAVGGGWLNNDNKEGEVERRSGIDIRLTEYTIVITAREVLYGECRYEPEYAKCS